MGVRVSIDVGKLIKEIVVGPREQEWVVNLVGKVVERYDLALPVVASNRLKPRR